MPIFDDTTRLLINRELFIFAVDVDFTLLAFEKRLFHDHRVLIRDFHLSKANQEDKPIVGFAGEFTRDADGTIAISASTSRNCYIPDGYQSIIKVKEFLKKRGERVRLSVD